MLRPGDLALGLQQPASAGSTGIGALVSSLVCQLRDHLDNHDATDRVRLSTTLIDLLAVGLAGPLDR